MKMGNEPREFTEDEVRDRFLTQVWVNIDYWDGAYDQIVADKSCREKLEGLAFSLLSMLDGCSVALPSFTVAPMPHPEDRDYHQEQGENWWPENHNADVKCDIGGCLHDLFHKADSRRKDQHETE